MRDEDLLRPQQLDDERLVVVDRVDLRVQPREQVEGAVGRLHGHAGDGVQAVLGEVALLEQPTAGQDEVVDGLVAAQCHLDGVLRGHVGAHPHVGQQGQALEEVGGPVLRPGHGHPAGAVARHPVRLGQA
ncbi:Uncharacterised protein [Streptococcus pneumoniae]|nr:Uncharacterised protein [Streptococcus pneumoniae]